MRKINRRDFLKAAGVFAAASALTACGGSDSSSTAAAGSGAASGEAAPSTLPAINEINLGEDYQDVTADIKILTNRTDIVDTVYAGYAEQFHELYPNITVTYEAVTDYEESLTLRIMTGEWGDICFIPTSVSKADLSSYFASMGELDTLEPIYNFIADKAFDGKVYGIANGGNADGVAYNKRVWEEAGITEAPATPDEFLADLQTIKDNTDAIPLYTNFAAGWTMGAWDAYIFGSATGDPDFHNNMPHMAHPFADRGDGTGPYAVYYTLYEAVARGLIEDDPMSTDWESSKGRINTGEIATMVLGSWAVQQFKDAGPNPDVISYMPFPITVDGKRYAGAGGNYSYGINVKSSAATRLRPCSTSSGCWMRAASSSTRAASPPAKTARCPLSWPTSRAWSWCPITRRRPARRTCSTRSTSRAKWASTTTTIPSAPCWRPPSPAARPWTRSWLSATPSGTAPRRSSVWK